MQRLPRSSTADEVHTGLEFGAIAQETLQTAADAVMLFKHGHGIAVAGQYASACQSAKAAPHDYNMRSAGAMCRFTHQAVSAYI